MPGAPTFACLLRSGVNWTDAFYRLSDLSNALCGDTRKQEERHPPGGPCFVAGTRSFPWKSPNRIQLGLQQSLAQEELEAAYSKYLTIRVVGMVNGVEKRDEKSVSVVSGGVENIELTLVSKFAILHLAK